MNWRIIILMVCLLVSIGVGQVLAQESEKVKFQIKLNKDDSFKVSRKSNINMDMVMASQVFTFTMYTDLQVLAVKQSEEALSYEIQETITRVKVDAAGDMGTQAYEISYDSAEEELDQDKEGEEDKNQMNRMMEKQMKPQMKQLVDQKFKYEVSDRGKIISWSAQLERGMGEMLTGDDIFAGMAAPLPEEAAVGFTWQQPFDPEATKSMSLPVDSSTFVCTSISTLKEVKQKLAMIESKLDFHKKAKDKEKDIAKDEDAEIDKILGEEKEEEERPFSMEASVESIEGEGSLVFDLTRGLPVEHKDRVKVSLNMDGNKWIMEIASQTKIE